MVFCFAWFHFSEPEKFHHAQLAKAITKTAAFLAAAIVRSTCAITWRWKSATDLAVGTVSQRQGRPSWGGVWRKPGAKPRSDERKLHKRHTETETKGYWAVVGSGILTHTITNERLARRGYYDISEAYKSMHYLWLNRRVPNGTHGGVRGRLIN